MFITLRSVKSLLLSIAILLVGHGLQLTLLPLHANSLGWSAGAIGYTASAYFVGFVLGCLIIPKMVSRVGHIRVFAVLSAVAAAVLLLMAIFEYFWVWLVARCLTGWAIAGLYMIIESWLNERSSTAQRGTIISVYAVITMLAIFVGQFLFALPLKNVESLFMLGAVLLLLGLVPVGLTRASTPQPIPVIKFNLRRLYRSTHVAVVGAFVGGLVTGGFWALGPLFADLKGLSTPQVGLFMAAGILGGAVFQLPFGKLSDSYDRRKIMVLICALSVVTCSLVVIASEVSVAAMYGLMFIFGATCFPIYSLCLAHANDHSKLELIEVASGILMLNGAGAVMAPIVIGPLMSLNAYALFYVFGAAYAMLGLWIAFRIRNHEVEVDESHPFVDLPKTTQSIVDLVPEDDTRHPTGDKVRQSTDEEPGDHGKPTDERDKVTPLIAAG